MTSTKFDDIRLKYKNKSIEILNWLKHTPKWKEYVEIMGLQDFNIVFVNNTHYEPLLHLLTKNYYESNPWLSIFPPDNDKPPDIIISKLKFITQNNGHALLAIHNKTNEIAVFHPKIDVCDLNDSMQYYYKHMTSSNTRYIGELIGKLYENLNHNINSNEYGNECWGGMTFVDKKYQHRGLFVALVFCDNIILNELGYTSIYGEATHIQIKNTAKLYGGTTKSIVDWKNFIFSDGKEMKYFLNKLYNKSHITYNEVIKKCILEFMQININFYDKTQKNDWKMYIDHHIKLIRKKIKNKSKL